MPSAIEITILKLRELGFFQFVLPFFIAAAILYGLLRKTQLFGPPEKNVAVNAVVAMSIAFFVLAWPVINGVNVEAQMSTFFMQGLSTLLIVMVVLIIGGMVLPPDLPKFISEKVKVNYLVGGLVILGVIVGIIIMVSSGLLQVFFPSGGLSFQSETFTTIGTIVLLLGAVLLIVFAAR